MKFETEKFKQTKLPLAELSLRSKNFYELIKKRRSIREFDKSPLDDEIIKNAILSAGSAPNGANLQPWHFVIIKDKNIKKKIRIAAEKEEKIFYKLKAPQDWLDALKPLGTNENKKFLENAPVLIVIFEKKFTIKKNIKIKNYYVKESVGIATGILISCLHYSGLCMLTHTPSPMNFLNKILKRPMNEKPFVLLVVGYAEKESIFASNVAKELVGENNVQMDVEPSMGGEDFSYLLNEKPGSYLYIGQRDVDHKGYLHTTKYDFNDDLLPIGVNFWVNLVKNFFQNN